jgi:hypothetical protein
MKLSLVIGPVGVLMGLRFQGGDEAEEELMHGRCRFCETEALFCVSRRW